MNDPINNAPDPNHNPHEPVAFCQNCSTILTHETIRKVGANVFCEPCLAARLASPPPPPGADPAGYGPGYNPVNTGTSPSGDPAGTAWQWGTGTPRGWTPGTAPGGAPNPGLAALLGLIPGVGAMYNEQYAKGLAHLLIFAVLVMFSHLSEIFGIFVIGWVAYMSVEAHHTAKARLEGIPLPNPFGLNDIGDRMGFTQNPGAPFTSPQDIATAAREAARDAREYATSNFNRPPTNDEQRTANNVPPTWGAPTDSYYTPPTYAPPYTQQPYANHPPYPEPAMPYNAAIPPYAVPPVPPMPAQPHFPTGAVILIGLGVIFLLGTMGVFHAIPGSALVGLVLLGIGVMNFFNRMTRTGTSLAYDGTSDYNLRLVRALDGSLWLVSIGGLWLLDSFHIIRWSNAWPWLIILVGVMMLAKRAAFNSAAAAYAPPIYPAYPPAPIVTPRPTNNDQPATNNEMPSSEDKGAL